MKKNILLFTSIFYALIVFAAAADITATFAKFEKIKTDLTSISPNLDKFNKHLDNGTYEKLHKNEKAPLEEAERQRGAAVKELEELSKSLDLNNPKSKSTLLSDFETQKKLVEYFLFFQKFNSGIDFCSNIRPAFEKYVLEMSKRNLKTDPAIIECQNFDKEEGQAHL